MIPRRKHSKEVPSHQGHESDPADRRLSAKVMAYNIPERFHRTRCGYTRLLRPGEDGFRLYVLHEQRCNPELGQQLWFPFIRGDDSN